MFKRGKSGRGTELVTNDFAQIVDRHREVEKHTEAIVRTSKKYTDAMLEMNKVRPGCAAHGEQADTHTHAHTNTHTHTHTHTRIHIRRERAGGGRGRERERDNSAKERSE